MQVLCQNENSPIERTPLNMYNKFIERVRRNLHVVLAFSPIGDAFRNRIRMFPSLINCCTIDWFKVIKKICSKLKHTFTSSLLLYPPQNRVLGGYTVFSLSVLPSFRPSVFPSFRPHLNILLCNLSSSCLVLFKFSTHLNHQTLHVL